MHNSGKIEMNNIYFNIFHLSIYHLSIFSRSSLTSKTYAQINSHNVISVVEQESQCITVHGNIISLSWEDFRIYRL